MPPQATQTSIAETIISLAESIARSAPECASKAMQIAEMAQSLTSTPDRTAIQDAIESKLVDSELSEAQVQATTSAVVSVIRDEV